MNLLYYFIAFAHIFCFQQIRITEASYIEKSKSFFPSDLSLVTWAHGVNSQKQLDEAFEEGVKMLEADLQMGLVIGAPTIEIVPIMAHPPAMVSDLSFKSFFNQVLASNKDKPSEQLQGLKLDFKSIEAVEPVLKIIQAADPSLITVPIWLNADILQGPINSTGVPVNASEFFRITAEYMPSATLSIGWKTSYPSGAKGGYTREQVQEMINLLRDHTEVNRTTPITYPLRAGIAAQSLENVMYLLDNSWNTTPPTITLWSSDGDTVDLSALTALVRAITKQRCYLDLPFDFSVGDEGTSSTTENGNGKIEIFSVFMVPLLFAMINCFYR